MSVKEPKGEYTIIIEGKRKKKEMNKKYMKG